MARGRRAARQALAQAEVALAAAEAAARGAGPRREALARVERAQPLRAERDHATRAAEALAEAAVRREEAAQAATRAQEERERAAEALDGADRALQAQLDAAATQAPALAAARALEVRLGEARVRSDGATRAAASARAESDEAAAALSALQRAWATREAERAAAASWLEARPGERALAAEWPRWEKALREHAQLCGDLTRADAALADARAREADRTAARETRRAELDRAEVELRRAADARARAEAAARGDDPERLAGEARTLAATRERLQALLEAARQARTAVGDEARARDEGARAAELTARLADEAGRNDRALAQADGRAVEARAAYARVEAALGLADRRRALVQGEPCPLCGAREHPYAEHAPGEDALAAQRDGVASAERAQKALEAEARRLAGARAEAETRGRKAGEDAAAAAARRATAEERYARLAGTVGVATPRRVEPGVPPVQGTLDFQPEPGRGGGLPATLPPRAADAVEPLEACGAEAIAAAERVDEARRTASGRARELEQARAAHDAAAKAVAGAREALGRAELALAQAAGEVRTQEERARALVLRRDGLESDLAPPLAFREGWREEARRSGPALARDCAAIAAEHARQEARAQEARQALSELTPRRERLAAACDEKRDRTRRAAETAAGEARAVAELRTEAGQVLGGRSADEVERALSAAERTARAARESAARAQGTAERALAAAVSRLEAAERARERAVEAESEARRALDGALSAAAIDRAELDRLLARDASWIAGERAALDALGDAAQIAATRLDERRRARELHAAGRPALAAEEARARREAAEGEEELARQALARAQAALEADGRSREAQRAVLAELERQRSATRRWQVLAGLIGSHDGRAFRTFAQGLTLQRLVAAANRHLQALAPRYRLARVPRSDLELQVIDGDLGDEPRGVNGLSGGESFLVSLALALGLASLSTRRAQARTLFIDEGFGTLDRDTLEQAMAAIEALGAGDRSVGIISHVPELHERIGVKVTVERVSAGRSRLVLPG